MSACDATRIRRHSPRNRGARATAPQSADDDSRSRDRAATTIRWRYCLRVPGIVVLNGPSSAGKSTLAKAVRARRGQGAALVSIDQLFAFMHPDARNNWQLFSTLTNALFANVVALHDGGYDVIAETVFERADCIAAMQRILRDRPYRLVAVTCPLDVLDAREQARGNRRLGQAREQHARVLHAARYDLELDTHAMSLETCVERVLGLL